MMAGAPASRDGLGAVAGDTGLGTSRIPEVSWLTPGSIGASSLASSRLGLFRFCPGSDSMSTLAPPSGVEVVEAVAWTATVYVVLDTFGACNA